MSPSKLVSWFLLMMISVVLVTMVYRPEPPAVTLMVRDEGGTPLRRDRREDAALETTAE